MPIRSCLTDHIHYSPTRWRCSMAWSWFWDKLAGNCKFTSRMCLPRPPPCNLGAPIPGITILAPGVVPRGMLTSSRPHAVSTTCLQPSIASDNFKCNCDQISTPFLVNDLCGFTCTCESNSDVNDQLPFMLSHHDRHTAVGLMLARSHLYCIYL